MKSIGQTNRIEFQKKKKKRREIRMLLCFMRVIARQNELRRKLILRTRFNVNDINFVHLRKLEHAHNKAKMKMKAYTIYNNT